MLRSNVILHILQGRSRSFLYISIKGFCTLLGSTVYSSLSFFFCPFVAAFVPVCQFFFTLLSRVVFGAGNVFESDWWHGQ